MEPILCRFCGERKWGRRRTLFRHCRVCLFVGRVWRRPAQYATLGGLIYILHIILIFAAIAMHPIAPLRIKGVDMSYLVSTIRRLAIVALAIWMIAGSASTSWAVTGLQQTTALGNLSFAFG